MVSTKKYFIQRVVNWYHGNFCTRKCFNKENRILNCSMDFQKIVQNNKDLLITHKEFKDLIDSDNIKICKLNPEFRRRTVGWKQFERWSKDSLFDPDAFE